MPILLYYKGVCLHYFRINLEGCRGICWTFSKLLMVVHWEIIWEKISSLVWPRLHIFRHTEIAVIKSPVKYFWSCLPGLPEAGLARPNKTRQLRPPISLLTGGFLFSFSRRFNLRPTPLRPLLLSSDGAYHPLLWLPGGHLYLKLDIIRVKGLSKHILNTYFSGMKIDPKYAFLHAFFIIWASCSFQKLSIWPKTYPFFQFCTLLHP